MKLGRKHFTARMLRTAAKHSQHTNQGPAASQVLAPVLHLTRDLCVPRDLPKIEGGFLANAANNLANFLTQTCEEIIRSEVDQGGPKGVCFQLDFRFVVFTPQVEDAAQTPADSVDTWAFAMCEVCRIPLTRYSQAPVRFVLPNGDLYEIQCDIHYNHLYSDPEMSVFCRVNYQPKTLQNLAPTDVIAFTPNTFDTLAQAIKQTALPDSTCGSPQCARSFKQLAELVCFVATQIAGQTGISGYTMGDLCRTYIDKAKKMVGANLLRYGGSIPTTGDIRYGVSLGAGEGVPKVTYEDVPGPLRDLFLLLFLHNSYEFCSLENHQTAISMPLVVQIVIPDQHNTQTPIDQLNRIQLVQKVLLTVPDSQLQKHSYSPRHFKLEAHYRDSFKESKPPLTFFLNQYARFIDRHNLRTLNDVERYTTSGRWEQDILQSWQAMRAELLNTPSIPEKVKHVLLTHKLFCDGNLSQEVSPLGYDEVDGFVPATIAAPKDFGAIALFAFQRENISLQRLIECGFVNESPPVLFIIWRKNSNVKWLYYNSEYRFFLGVNLTELFYNLGLQHENPSMPKLSEEQVLANWRKLWHRARPIQ